MLGVNKMIISVVNLIKGGVGKSTIAINLTAMLEHDGKSVKLIDMDEAQGAAYKWSIKAGINGFFNPTLDELSELIEDKESAFIFDTGGYDLVTTQALMSVSDIILIPTGISPIGIEAFASLIGKIENIKNILDKQMNLIIVPNMIDTRLKKVSAAKQFTVLKELGYKISPTIHRRVAYEKSYKDGGSVLTHGDIKARTEIYNLSEYIKDCM